ncbi:hypothetical protein AB0J86_11075 [Micromonospora sp. NPDC049559]
MTVNPDHVASRPVDTLRAVLGRWAVLRRNARRPRTRSFARRRPA